MKIGAVLRQWRFTLILIGAVFIGAMIGWKLGPKAVMFKPLGDIFLNLLFTAVVPLVFFSMSSAIACSSNLKRLGRIAGLTLVIFIITGFISACLMIFAVKVFDPAKALSSPLAAQSEQETDNYAQQAVNLFTVPDFQNLLTRDHILALIVFAILTGLASQAAGEKGKAFRDFLVSGFEVMSKLIRLIMLYAPIGLAAYFAYMVGQYGDKLVDTYVRAVQLYYPIALLYFAVGFSFYTYIAAGPEGIRRFWACIPPVALMAWGTGSSLAALPVNLESAKRIGVTEDIREMVLPLGATIHMDGSCLAAILKIAMLFALFGRNFSGFDVYAKAIGIAILSGTVISGIPGGGIIGEMLIVTTYGFGLEALPIITMLGAFVDPPATMVNASGDTVAAMLVNRVLEGKGWLKKAFI
jgi:Na+/H+-dicarboxylate symporter